MHKDAVFTRSILHCSSHVLQKLHYSSVPKSYSKINIKLPFEQCLFIYIAKGLFSMKILVNR